MNIGDIVTIENYAETIKWCNDNNAKLEEIESKGEERQFKIVEIPEPTEEELKQARIDELKSKLQETDYVVIKIAEGEATQEEYAEVLAQRKAWRAEINDLEKENV